MLTLDLNVSAGRAFTAIGIIGGPTESFTTSTLSATTSNLGGVDNTYTLTFRPSSDIVAGATITLSGLTGSQTSNNASLTIAGAGASLFGSSANWTQSSGSLVLTVDTGQTVPNGSDTVITFVLANPASSAGVTSVNLSSAGYATATISGLFLASAANKYNIPDSTDQQTEATILALTPTNPAGEVTVKFGSDTYDLYVWDGSVWFIYREDFPFSVDFDGTDDYMDCGGASAFSFTDGAGNDSPFSISAWVKFDDTNRERLVSKDTSTSSREFLFGTNNSNKVNMLLGTATTNLDIQNNTTLNTTDWFHVVSTYDGSGSASGLKVYVNADASSLTDSSLGSYAGMPSTSGNLEIGRFANGHSFFNGLVDEVAIFNYELTSSQVSDIYNSGSPADISSLSPLGWWRMGDDDSGTGTTITDQGSGGNNGTLTNGPTFSTTVPS